MNFLSDFDFKTFLVAGFLFGIGMMVIDYYMGASYNVWRTLFISLFFGLYMSLSKRSWKRKNRKEN